MSILSFRSSVADDSFRLGYDIVSLSSSYGRGEGGV